MTASDRGTLGSPEKIRVVQALPGAPATVEEIDNTLGALQALVGGPIEGFRGLPELHARGLHAYIHDEGQLIELPRNVLLGDGPWDQICGPIVISKADCWGDEIGLTMDEAAIAARYIDGLRIEQGLLASR